MNLGDPSTHVPCSPGQIDPAGPSAPARAPTTVQLPSPGTTPYWEAKTVRLFLGDSLSLLSGFPPETFDLIFADPPYFLSSGGTTCHAGRMVSVDKGAWDKPPPPEQIHEFNVEWLRLCKRVLKPDGTIWVSGTLHNIYSVGYAMQTLGLRILNDIAWFKVNPPPNLGCRCFAHATETILWASKGKRAKHTFNYEEMKRANGNRQMQSLWHIPPPGPGEKRYGKHPTQKPEALLSRIIAASSLPGGFVLDPFCGSGTTGVACVRLGRVFVGIELERDYIDVAKQRISDEVAQCVLSFD
ncbi:MAG: methyltransferase [Fimbriimonadales bacterium]